MFHFVSGNLALDFAGTVRYRSTDFQDDMTTADDLANWLVAAELLDTAPPCDPATFEHAVLLREAVYRMALAAANGAPNATEDRDLVNAAARGELPELTLRADDTASRSGTARAALTAVARAAIELLGGPDRRRVKTCGRPACTRLYVDTSRGGSRRWCDMARCGNRAKSANFRARHANDQ
ncbi:CGNR zinc finger domain-containing protein [Nocardia sp. NEAU-351]|uniref:CGNR zinc finger domain-containing protein n=1 Tax=Nocardia bovistercoris TaxID=2785916 RepID=A0A931N484_9NOCA|nr:CGNR zinc finger domain-containing protein [Nocardia bovistercoris]